MNYLDCKTARSFVIHSDVRSLMCCAGKAVLEEPGRQMETSTSAQNAQHINEKIDFQGITLSKYFNWKCDYVRGQQWYLCRMCCALLCDSTPCFHVCKPIDMLIMQCWRNVYWAHTVRMEIEKGSCRTCLHTSVHMSASVSTFIFAAITYQVELINSVIRRSLLIYENWVVVRGRIQCVQRHFAEWRSHDFNANGRYSGWRTFVTTKW